VRATFLPVGPGVLGRVLPFMSHLYQQDESYDPVRARAVSEWLLANPDCGAIWLIEADSADVGYMVVTVCVSLEFQGRFALLDELYLDPPWRGRGIASQAIDFAAAVGGFPRDVRAAPGNGRRQRARDPCLPQGRLHSPPATFDDEVLVTAWATIVHLGGTPDSGMIAA
jgi:GNAT superfamily N-acetyltransferase